MPKNNWRPSASLEKLKERARLLQLIRDFFRERNVLEVETPLLSHTSVTNPYIQSIMAPPYYLQTSPEYAMKRLLAAGSGAIFQLTKAFRQDEAGRLHNPEFTLLEWYQPGFDHHALMNETDLLLQHILHTPPAIRRTYAELFQTHLQIDPHTATLEELVDCAKKHALSVQGHITDRDTWLQLLMGHCIEPFISQDTPCFIYDFPVTQAALARLRHTHPPVASRFEVNFRGIELANGFHELQDASEQRHRFQQELAAREKLGLATLPIDELFLASLEYGLPDCAGVAVGVDRIIMLATQSERIADILSFDITRA